MSEKENLESQLDYLKSQLEWYNLFVDYTQSVDINLYNEACEYVDLCEC